MNRLLFVEYLNRPWPLLRVLTSLDRHTAQWEHSLWVCGGGGGGGLNYGKNM